MTAAPRRVRFDVAYDGTDFVGWQVQPASRTVQGTIEDALKRIQGNVPLRLRGAGRTDAGVHARMQVADCDLVTDLDDGALHYALCGMLPADVRVVAVRTVAANFHSKEHAEQRTYRYRLDRCRHGDPFVRRFALHYPYALNAAQVREGLEMLEGERDFSGFASAKCVSENRVRHMIRADLVEDGPDSSWFRFTANGFLTFMVRNLVGTLLEIARGRFEPSRIREVLDSGDRRLAGPTAPAHGLCLWHVRYKEDDSG